MNALPPPEPEDPLLTRDLFDFLLKNTPDQVYFKDREGRFLRVSRAVADLFGAGQAANVLGKTDFDFLAPATAEEAARDEKRVMETGEPLVGKIEKLVHPDGRVAWDYTTKLPLRDARGEIIGICGINKDFTAVKEMQDALRDERNRLRELTEQLRARNEQTQADLRMASAVQRALLPRECPPVSADGPGPGRTISFRHLYRPAAEVGGDFFDLLPISRGRVGVLVCDVMGHGLRAALVTAIIRALTVELAAAAGDAGGFLTALNAHLRPILSPEEHPVIASALYLVADGRRRTVSYANAGHPFPLRLRRAAGTAESLAPASTLPGPALGLFDDERYATMRSPFGPGDCLLLFTDGLYEITSPAGEELGPERLAAAASRHAALPADELFSALVADALRFASKPEFDDDLCLVAVERSGE